MLYKRKTKTQDIEKKKGNKMFGFIETKQYDENILNLYKFSKILYCITFLIFI